MKLTDPQAAYAYEMAGPDSHQLAIPVPPGFSSAGIAAETVELYWFALTRDVPFNQYETNPLIAAAAEELSSLPAYSGPRVNGKVTTRTIFSDRIEGDTLGPRVSQFLLKDIPFISNRISQKYRTAIAGDDHLTNYDEWLHVQNGGVPSTSNTYDLFPRYIRNYRDLGEWVHQDLSIDSGQIACRILHSFGEEALAPSNPYVRSDTQAGFSTFGAPHIFDFVLRASRPALEAAWFQKWLVHRRLRPEELGGRIHNHKTGRATYPIHSSLLNSRALELSYQRFGSYLLPQAYPEGCPTHPAYPSGHSTFIGAMVTMLKAFFDESYIIPNPVIPSSDGLTLFPYDGPPLTVGGELNKLASNIGNARIAAGVHFRSSNLNGYLLGEKVAIGILRDYRKTYNERFNGFRFTKFNGTKITI
ncbi:vanadium-dependent haloperoxidase [Paenibacillus sp. TRM 82003]|nr:vanadium-dependent haloperoxidase [Paenibacillus sp. TRM 82003]